MALFHGPAHELDEIAHILFRRIKRRHQSHFRDLFIPHVEEVSLLQRRHELPRYHREDTVRINGLRELDPVTPPWLAQNVAKTLSHSRLVLVHNATHNSYSCIENLVADFIDKGTTEGLDVSCTEKIQRPPFTILK